uniref:Putative secreted protein n=1 Tax=Ixodes ricinus TaxID=34613 RepID=A0A6B0U879_IXORI
MPLLLLKWKLLLTLLKIIIPFVLGSTEYVCLEPTFPDLLLALKKISWTPRFLLTAQQLETQASLARLRATPKCVPLLRFTKSL